MPIVDQNLPSYRIANAVLALIESPSLDNMADLQRELAVLDASPTMARMLELAERSELLDDILAAFESVAPRTTIFSRDLASGPAFGPGPYRAPSPWPGPQFRGLTGPALREAVAVRMAMLGVPLRR